MDDLTPEQEEVVREFEADLKRFAEESLLGEPQTPEQLAAGVTEMMRDQLERELRRRAVPEEWWVHLLVDVEAEAAEQGAVFITVNVPEEIRAWMQRPIVRYRPGQAPV